MALKFYPRAGQVLICDFSGFQPPEMVKVRPVILISPKLPNRSEIAAVVPISTTPPMREFPFVVRLSKNYHPLESDDLPVWAKCDMVTNLAVHRLSGFKVGRRRWDFPQASGDDLMAVRIGVLKGLGLDRLLNET